VRLERHKPRNLIMSVACRLKPLVPLDAMLDLAAIVHRLAFEKAAEHGLGVFGDNPFLFEQIKPTDRVLEIGCSSGRVLSQVRAAERVGVDYDKAAIERGRLEHPDLTLVHADARDFLKSADRFDVAILSHVLEHLDEPEALLSALDSDRIYIEVPDFEWNTLNDVRRERGRAMVYLDVDHVAEFDRNEIEELFRNCGFNIIDREFRWGFMRYWLKRSRP
jgi:SAM-dependent methyltransferase